MNIFKYTALSILGIIASIILLCCIPFVFILAALFIDNGVKPLNEKEKNFYINGETHG